jgi:hypothetical protein
MAVEARGRSLVSIESLRDAVSGDFTQIPLRILHESLNLELNPFPELEDRRNYRVHFYLST